LGTCPKANEGDTTDERRHVLSNSRNNGTDDGEAGSKDKEPSSTENVLGQTKVRKRRTGYPKRSLIRPTSSNEIDRVRVYTKDTQLMFGSGPISELIKASAGAAKPKPPTAAVRPVPTASMVPRKKGLR
jgi:hypothetical protein